VVIQYWHRSTKLGLSRRKRAQVSLAAGRLAASRIYSSLPGSIELARLLSSWAGTTIRFRRRQMKVKEEGSLSRGLLLVSIIYRLSLLAEIPNLARGKSYRRIIESRRERLTPSRSQATVHINWRRRQLMTWHTEHTQIVCRNLPPTSTRTNEMAQMTYGRSNHWWQPTGIFSRTTIANTMVEIERHPSVYLSSGAQIKLRRLEMRLRR
jgi:hypothetical protein